MRVAQTVAGDLATVLEETAAAVRATRDAEPPGRLVRTRHGDAMLLEDFLLTRVVEVAVHGLDVADAAAVPPWLTPTARDQILGLLFGPHWPEAVESLGGDPLTVIRKATGRAPADATDRARLDAAGLRRLALG